MTVRTVASALLIVALLAVGAVRAANLDGPRLDAGSTTRPSITDASLRAATKPIATKKIILVGDSTMQANTGYGGAFCARHVMSTLACLNLARGGRSSFSYRAEGSWRIALSEMKSPHHEAVYVLIQFGHNDMPGKPGRSTDLPEYADNLRQYVQDVRATGAIPVVFTPLTRRSFEGGKLIDDLAPWAQAAIQVANDLKVPVVDLHAASVAQVQNLGAEGAFEYAQIPPPVDAVLAARSGTTIKVERPTDPPPPVGAAKGQIKPYFDYTHLGERGAEMTASLVAELLAQSVPDLAGDLIK